MVILWDVYHAHRDKEILEKLKAKYPNLIVLFVPASCTSQLQPLDVYFNQPWKGMVTKLACEYLSDFIAKQLRSGVAPSDVTVPSKKSELVEPFCEWVASATEWIRPQKEVLLRGWKESGISIAFDDTEPSYGKLLEEQITQADEGCDFRFLHHHDQPIPDPEIH